MDHHEQDELGRLCAQLRANLSWQQRFGRRGAPASATPRRAPAPAPAGTASDPADAPASAPAPAGTAGDPADAPASAPTSRVSLEEVRRELGECQRCKLSAGRNTLVFGVGSPEAEVVLVGEGPGAEEDRQGEPFVGPAGKLLDRMLKAMGLARDTVYICNIVKCRPPRNRDPEPDEVAACEPFLRQQLEALSPRIIIALGRYAAQSLLGTSAPLGALRGRWGEHRGIQLMPTYHPAALLRNEALKRPAWDDLKLVMAEMDRLGLRRRR